MQFGKRSLSLDEPRVMGILNVTPDSFFDGGKLYDQQGLIIDSALHKAEAMVAAGADFIDIGGESTRPGAEAPSCQEEMQRVLPIVEALAGNIDAVISIDTSNPELMREAANLGAGLINDVRALRLDGALTAAADSGLPICLMHMQGEPQTMQQQADYESVVDCVADYFDQRISACRAAGIDHQQLILDPGIGFGKTLAHNRALLKATPRFAADYPVLIGVSRKSMIGHILGHDTDGRLIGSLALAYDALMRGASIVRVHDVDETADVVNMFKFMQQD